MESMVDELIIGGGAAGCVLANRLSQDPARRVLLLEAGPADRHPLIHMPKGIGKLIGNPRYIWPFSVRRRPDADSDSSVWIRGKTLGGSSSVNGAMYVRGQPADFDQLATLSSADWSWSQMGAVYRAMECHELGATETRGTEGPLRISMPGRGDPVLGELIRAANQLGLPFQDDINTPDNREKIGYGPRTIYKGRRQSAAVAFLRPVRRRPNLEVRTDALVDRVLFDGARAVGVVAEIGGRSVQINAKRVIVAAGTLSSPAILQRSGIGPASLLAALGIECIADRAEVGRNLQEHCTVLMQWRLKNTPSHNPQYHGARLLLNVLNYLLTHRGLMGDATNDLIGWFKTRPELERPNIQFLVSPHSFDYSQQYMSVEKAPGLQIAPYPLRPRAKGEVRIRSRDAHDLPDAWHDPLSDADDRQELIDMVRYARKLVAESPLAGYIVEETRPGVAYHTDDEILDAVSKLSTSAYHAAGTCRMGSDEASVVDPLTRVRGVRNLHVVDLSIAPFVLAGNTCAPVMAMAWRAADLIRALPVE